MSRMKGYPGKCFESSILYMVGNIIKKVGSRIHASPNWRWRMGAWSALAALLSTDSSLLKGKMAWIKRSIKVTSHIPNHPFSQSIVAVTLLVSAVCTYTSGVDCWCLSHTFCFSSTRSSDFEQVICVCLVEMISVCWHTRNLCNNFVKGTNTTCFTKLVMASVVHAVYYKLQDKNALPGMNNSVSHCRLPSRVAFSSLSGLIMEGVWEALSHTSQVKNSFRE